MSKAKVSGIGGIFFKSDDPKGQLAWYQEHLGIEPGEGYVGSTFPWRHADDPERPGNTIWSLFERDTQYFGPPGGADFMVNYRVDDLDAMLAQLEDGGVTVLPAREDGEFGRFAWIVDPEGNRIELWEPPEGM